MAIDWWQLRHAYGRATDTPGHLHALEFGDTDARQAALCHLDVAVLHQGFPESATAPAVRAVTELLAERRAHPDTVELLLQFVGDVARSVIGLAGDDDFAEHLPDLTDAVAEAYPVALFLLMDSAPVRTALRATNLVAIAQISALADRREELAALTLELSARDPGPREPWVYCLSQLGVDLSHLLSDPDPAVRLRAALNHEDDPRSQELILAALAGPPPRGLHYGELVAAAIRIASDFDMIAAAACELASRDSWTGFDDGWGALVGFAFPEPYGQRRPLTNAQRGLVRALVANDDKQLWNPKNASCGLVFRRAGLRHNRDACRQLVQ